MLFGVRIEPTRNRFEILIGNLFTYIFALVQVIQQRLRLRIGCLDARSGQGSYDLLGVRITRKPIHNLGEFVRRDLIDELVHVCTHDSSSRILSFLLSKNTSILLTFRWHFLGTARHNDEHNESNCDKMLV